jgi:hypothetical protein
VKISIAAALLLAATPAAAQQVAPPSPVQAPGAPNFVPDAAATARYVADFTRLCLDTGGERAAVRTAAVEAGWTPAAAGPELATAVDLAAFDSPDGLGGQLLTSASSPGEMPGGLIVRTCILQPHGGSAGSRADLAAATSEVMGLPGKSTMQGLVWLVSGDRRTGYVDEAANFVAAGSTDAGFALALQRPLFMLTMVGDEAEAGLALMRVSVE